MKYLITGAAGFIGSNLCKALVKDKQNQVLGYDKLTYAANFTSLEQLKSLNNFSFVRGDICDELKLKQVFEEFEPNILMNLAAESHVDRSIEGPGEFVKTNIIGTYALLQQALNYWKEADGPLRAKFKFIHVSTDEVFGDLATNSDFFKENTAYKPSSPYSATKASSDHLVRAWGRTYGLPVLITNCSNNYGPFQFPEKLIPNSILSAILGKEIPVYGDGSQIRDWLFVGDHVDALRVVANKASVGETFNIGGSNEVRNLDVVTLICEILDEIAPPLQGFQSYKELITFVADRPGHDRRYAVDSGKIKNLLGWQPQENFESGIYKTIKWYLNNKDWWSSIYDGSYLTSMQKEK